MDNWLESTKGVVSPHADGNAHPAYDGPYLILFDAVEGDSNFGSTYNLTIDHELEKTEFFAEGNIAAALKSLSTNESIANPLTGESWTERVQKVVAFNEDDSIRYIRMEVLVEVKTSSDSSAVLAALRNDVGNFAEHPGLQGTNVYIAGDIVSLEAVLDGLTESQLQLNLKIMLRMTQNSQIKI